MWFTLCLLRGFFFGRRRKAMRKNYVLDTNVLLEDPDAIFGFEDNNVILTSTVLEELDSKKTEQGETGYHARECIRRIESLRQQGSLLDGIPLPDGGTLTVEPDGIDQNNLPNGYDIAKNDSKIISACVSLKKQKAKEPVILVSSDLAMRIKASVVLSPSGVENYRNTVVRPQEKPKDQVLEVSDDLITRLYEEGSAEDTVLDQELEENAFLTLTCTTESVLAVHRKGKLFRIREQSLFGNVRPMNAMQAYAVWALMAPAEEVPLVILEGPAGTAKTYLSLAAGLTCTHLHQDYYKMLISRPNTTAADPGFGFLPGDLDDKMKPLLLPYYDNLEVLFRSQEDSGKVQKKIASLFDSGIISLCPLSYIRGRSLMKSYLICDEAQNASRSLIRDVITRAGSGTKIILAGDPDQCDNPLLDSRSNGLVYAEECFRNTSMAAMVRFREEHSVRSPLAREAVRRMH